jgi:hypothetical protein
LSRRTPELSLERTAKRGFGPIPRGGGDLGDALSAALQDFRPQLQAPSRQVRHRGLAQKMVKALGQASLHKELTDLWSAHNQATGGSTQVDGEYLEVIATRR